MNAPCKDCTERAAGCHSTCEKYIAYDKERQEIRGKKAITTLLNDYGPNKKSRVRKYERNKMKGHGK